MRKIRNLDPSRPRTRLARQGAEERTVKALLAQKINRILERREFTQAAASELLGMPQPKISAIRNYKLTWISLERLLEALTALDQRVEIVVRPSTSGTPPRIAVDG